MKGFGAGAGPGPLRFAVLGYPARHSLSPRMHEGGFRALGMDATYEAIEVPPERLDRELDRLHGAGYSGLNLTTPLKERAVALVRSVTPEGSAAGAVNTLRREVDGWAGHATDGPGFVAWVRETGVRVRGARVLLAGAGGAARSIAPNLVTLEPMSVDIVSRSGAHAGELADRVRTLVSGSIPVRAAALDDDPPAEKRGLLIRLLSTAEVGAAEARWWESLDGGAAVLEGNYEERASGARALAAERGLRFEDGLGLLLHQGARSFQFWTGFEPPVEAMRDALRKNG